MTISARTPYVLGALHQICSVCRWWQSGHAAEVLQCPLCGAAVADAAVLEFGGVTVVFDGTRFTFYGFDGSKVSVDAADYPDVIAFMGRHAKQAVRNLGPVTPNGVKAGVGDSYLQQNPKMCHTRFEPRR